MQTETHKLNAEYTCPKKAKYLHIPHVYNINLTDIKLALE